ncbi:MAG: DEAD/DEAH box helicase [Oligoflexales bacterium]|nr:DEAD/DEAH box helicase [Oligoflexales bacterium]
MPLGLLPGGHLFIKSPLFGSEDRGGNEPLQESLEKILKEKRQGEALLELSKVDPSLASIDPTVYYWRQFAVQFLNHTFIGEWLDLPPAEADIPPPESLIADITDGAPPMPGGEYLNSELLTLLWQEMITDLGNKSTSPDETLRQLMEREFAAWSHIGRLFFHLAENKKDATRPFAFLATYTNRISLGTRMQHIPLGRALSEFAGRQNHATLVNLLKPLVKAGEESLLVQGLLSNNDIYKTLFWTPKEALLFLKEIPIFEKNGIIVRVPDWWKGRSGGGIKMKVTLGRSGKSKLTSGSMLDFDARLALDGEDLSEEEFNHILATGEGLISIKGRWVEIDRDRLGELLSNWKEMTSRVNRDGISFNEAMRLLAGAQIPVKGDGDHSFMSGDLIEIAAGEALSDILNRLRNPDMTQANQDNEFPIQEMLTRYLRTTLRPYQDIGVRWLYLLYQLKLGGCLADDMGLGKTVQILSLFLLIKYCRRADEQQRPHLLVIPASLIANWAAEIKRFSPDLNYVIAHGSMQTKEELSAQIHAGFSGFDIVITTYGFLQRLPGFNEVSWNIVVLDEAQAIKNADTKQTRAVKRLKAQHRLILTGTPLENRLSDLWSLFDFISPGLLGSPDIFTRYIKNLNTTQKQDYGPLRRLVRPYILRRLKTDSKVIADLPEKTELKCYCTLSRQQVALYQQSVEELTEELQKDKLEGIKRQGLILSYLLRFKQICNHPSQWLGDHGYDPVVSGKFSRLFDLCETIAEKQEKVLIFTQFREITDVIAQFLEPVYGRPGVILHGGTPVKKRQMLVDSFQDEMGPPFFILSLKAGGTGLNLTAASHVIHFDRWWNPAVENQATDRAFRIGQKRNVLVHKFICKGTIEERIDEMIENKKMIAEEILGGGEKILTEMSDEELIKMVTLDIHALNVE